MDLPKGDVTPYVYLLKWMTRGRGQQSQKMGDIIYGQKIFKLPLFFCEKIMQYIFFYFQSTIEQQAHIIRWSMYFSYSKLTQTERNSLANLQLDHGKLHIFPKISEKRKID